MVPTGYNPEYLQCRSDGHSWMHQSTESVPNARGLAQRNLYCPRHEGFRIDVVNMQDGIVLKRRYVMPKGYNITGQGMTPRAEFRRVLIRREMKEAMA